MKKRLRLILAIGLVSVLSLPAFTVEVPPVISICVTSPASASGICLYDTYPGVGGSRCHQVDFPELADCSGTITLYQ